MPYSVVQSPADAESGSESGDPLRQIIHDAISYIDTEVSPQRAKATDYYHGRPFGNEVDGRSKIVHTVVRDTVEQTLPSVLRVVFGPEHTVEFTPENQESVAKAEEATNFVRHVFENESGGFLKTVSVLKDGFIRKMGIFKWYWDDTSETKNYSLSNIDEEGLMLLMAEEGVTVNKILPQPSSSVIPGAPMLYDVEITRVDNDGRVCIEAVPPEEFYYNRTARDLDNAIIVGHRTRKTRSELIEMGIDPADIDAHGGSSVDLDSNPEAIARDVYDGGILDESAGKENEGILYTENYVRIDRDGDEKAELRRICTIGPAYYEVSDDATDEVPFAIYCPIPEPHTLTGQSLADCTMDLQLVESTLIRGMLDSLGNSIFPRNVYKEGDANVQDILNTDIGAPIRTRSGPTAVASLAQPFIGKEALPVLAFFQDVQESRVGRAGGAQGLHMDSMQSSTRAAVAAAVTDAQLRSELQTRIFCEVTLKRLFRGILKMQVQHKPKPRMVRMNGAWSNIDPRVWDADMDVQVNVALGSGMTEEKIATLDAVIAKQEQVMGLLGPDNAMVDLALYRNALSDDFALRGRKDFDRFFKPLGPAEMQAMREKQAQQQPQEQESPEQVIANAQIQIEQMKAQRELAVKEAELAMKRQQQDIDQQSAQQKMVMENELERYRIKLEDDRQRDRQSAEMALKRMEIEAKYQVQLTAAQLKQETDMARATSQAGPEGE